MDATTLNKRLLWLSVSLVGLLSATTWMLVDSASQVARLRRAPIRAVARLLGTADFALSSSSRWLRHPSLSEPGAPFSDAPAILDIDPGGAVIGPPHELLAKPYTYSRDVHQLKSMR